MNGIIIKVINSLECSGLLTDGFTETVQDKTKKASRWIFLIFVSNFSRFVNATSNFFSSKMYKWKESQKSRKTIHE